jgi:tRNA G18 (ribose-2'-O)-methylase SpoU
MGTIIRSANAFGVRHVHIIGRRQWNKRGAMMTDKYLHVDYYATVDEFIESNTGRMIIAVDNIPGALTLDEVVFNDKAVLVFGSERDGISSELLSRVAYCVAIEQFGSTRSLNVGVAAGIVMYEWVRQRNRKRIDKNI